MAGSHSTNTPLTTLTMVTYSLLARVGRDEVVEHNQKEQDDSHEVAEHCQLHVGDHLADLNTQNVQKFKNVGKNFDFSAFLLTVYV